MREFDKTQNRKPTVDTGGRSGSGDPALPIADLDPDTIIRWKVFAPDVILSRALLAQMFPQAIQSTEVVDELLKEDRRALPLVYALIWIVSRILRVVLSSTVVVMLLFALLWFLGSLANHSMAVMVLACGVAIWLTAFAIVEAVTRILCTGSTQRDQKSSNVRVAGFLSLPLMMYVAACPTTTDFVIGATEVQPGFWDWSWYYCFVLIDILAAGIPQGVFGAFTVFHSPSLVGALSLFWVKAVMLVGVVAVIFTIIRHALTDSHTFVGTISQFRQWANHRFGTGEEKGITGKAFWNRWLLGGGKRRQYEVLARAVEQPFSGGQLGQSLVTFQYHSFPEWTVDTKGVLQNREIQQLEEWAKKRERIWSKMRGTTLRARLWVHLKSVGFLILVTLALPIAALTLGIIPAAFTLPVFLISFYLLKLDLGVSIAIYALSTLFFWSLDLFFEKRRGSGRFLILSRIRSHAIHGTGAVSPEELKKLASGGSLGLIPRTARFIVHLISSSYKAIFRKSADATDQEKLAAKELQLTAGPVDFYASVELSGGLVVIVTKEARTAWIFHDRPLRSQGNLRFLYSVGSHLITIPHSERGEWLDVLETSGKKVEGLSECDRAVTVLVRNGKEPIHSDDIQELQIVYAAQNYFDNLLHLGREFKGPEQAENPYRYSNVESQNQESATGPLE